MTQQARHAGSGGNVAAGTPADEKIRTIGTAVIIGSIASAISVFLLVSFGMWAISGSAGFGFALGAFCSAWVGPGFGVMVGGVMNALSEERAAARRGKVETAAAAQGTVV